MSKIIYFDCFSGISGDMIIGALLDLGLDFKLFEREMKKLNFYEFSIEIKPVSKNHIAASKFNVIDKGKKVYRHPKDLYAIVDNSSFDKNIKNRAKDIFRKIAEAEAKIHGVAVEKIHFHEIGAVDTIVDVVGALVGLSLLEIEKVFCSKINVGSGFVNIAHGKYPVPAPATTEILKGAPIYSSGTEGELVTPTGAAIISELANEYGNMPQMLVAQIGYGAGSRNMEQPNVLRAFVGEDFAVDDVHAANISIIDTNIDDMNPQFYELLFERLFEAGALDVFMTNILMKKNRPATQLTVLCNHQDEQKISNIIFRETSSIGIRIRHESKKSLERENKLIDSEFGKVNIKICKLEGEIINIKPEYEDCKKIAQKTKLPLSKVYQQILKTLK